MHLTVCLQSVPTMPTSSSSTSPSVRSSQPLGAHPPETFAAFASQLTWFAIVANNRRTSNSSGIIRLRSVGVSTPWGPRLHHKRGTDTRQVLPLGLDQLHRLNDPARRASLLADALVDRRFGSRLTAPSLPASAATHPQPDTNEAAKRLEIQLRGTKGACSGTSEPAPAGERSGPAACKPQVHAAACARGRNHRRSRPLRPGEKRAPGPQLGRQRQGWVASTHGTRATTSPDVTVPRNASVQVQRQR